MARLSAILIPAGDTDIKIAALATTTASTIQTLGKNRIFVINADQDITIQFGNAAGPSFTPTAANYRIPANQQTTFDLGSSFDSLKVFNLSGSTAANIYIKFLALS